MLRLSVGPSPYRIIRITVIFIIKIIIYHLQANIHKEHHRAGAPGVYGDEVPGGA